MSLAISLFYRQRLKLFVLFISFLAFFFFLFSRYDYPVKHPSLRPFLSDARSFQSEPSPKYFHQIFSTHARSSQWPFSCWILFLYYTYNKGFWLRQACPAHCIRLLLIVLNLRGLWKINPSSLFILTLLSLLSISFTAALRTAEQIACNNATNSWVQNLEAETRTATLVHRKNDVNKGLGTPKALQNGNVISQLIG